MGNASPFNDPFARRGAPARDGFGGGQDHFKRDTPKPPPAKFDKPRDGGPKADAFAAKAAQKPAASDPFYNPFGSRPAQPGATPFAARPAPAAPRPDAFAAAAPAVAAAAPVVRSPRPDPVFDAAPAPRAPDPVFDAPKPAPAAPAVATEAPVVKPLAIEPVVRPAASVASVETQTAVPAEPVPPPPPVEPVVTRPVAAAPAEATVVVRQPAPVVQPAVLRQAAEPAEQADQSQRILANGAALQVVASHPYAPAREAGAGLMRKEKRPARSSSMVLVSSAVAVAAPTASAFAASTGGAGGGQGALDLPAGTPTTKRSGGGGGGLPPGGGGAGPARRDRMFNQDDLVGAVLGIAMLALLLLLLFRSNKDQPAQDNRLATPQFAATEALVSPQAAPVAPPADPFGDAAVDLKPKGPIPQAAPPPAAPPEVAVAEATPTPPPTIDKPLHAWFCTAQSGLTTAARSALDKQVADFSAALQGKKLVVRGYADTRGTTLYNTALSGSRARAVADFFRTKGIEVAEFKGEGELAGLDDNQDCANQRRVDVWIEGAPGADPSRTCAAPKEDEALVCA